MARKSQAVVSSWLVTRVLCKVEAQICSAGAYSHWVTRRAFLNGFVPSRTQCVSHV